MSESPFALCYRRGISNPRRRDRLRDARGGPGPRPRGPRAPKSIYPRVPGTAFFAGPASTTPRPLAPACFVKAIRRRGRRRRTRNSMEPPVPRRALVQKVPGGTSATSACRTASVATAPMRRPRRRPPVTYTRRDGAAQGWNASAPPTLIVARHVVRTEHRRVELVLDGKERVHHRRRGRNTVEDKCYALSGRR